MRKVIDERARVHDSKVGFLGWAFGPGVTWFDYSLVVKPSKGGKYGAPLCGKGFIHNKAWVAGEDTGIGARDSVTVPVSVLCFAKKDDGKKDDGKSGGKTPPVIVPDDKPIVNDKG